MWIDSHCHLDAPEFAADLSAVIARSRAAGVSRWLLPAVRAADFARASGIARVAGADLALGLHPVYINEHHDYQLLELDTLINKGGVCAVGEIGLDFYVPGLDAVRQIEIFEAQLKLARDHDLPVIVHIRRSQDQVLKYLRKWRVKGGIAHAFNGSEQQAAQFIELGFKLGFGGALTYSGSKRIRQLAATLPLETIVLETDSPDMAPAWLAGPPPARNEPAQLPQIAAELAALRGMTLAELAAATGANYACVISTQA